MERHGSDRAKATQLGEPTEERTSQAQKPGSIDVPESADSSGRFPGVRFGRAVSDSRKEAAPAGAHQSCGSGNLGSHSNSGCSDPIQPPGLLRVVQPLGKQEARRALMTSRARDGRSRAKAARLFYYLFFNDRKLNIVDSGVVKGQHNMARLISETHGTIPSEHRIKVLKINRVPAL